MSVIEKLRNYKAMQVIKEHQERYPMAEQQKELPSVEYSLKNISWHMKTLVEEIKKLNSNLERLGNQRSLEEQGINF